MIFIAIIAIVGIWKKQDKIYWRNAFFAVVLQYLATFLFHGDTGLISTQYLGESLWYVSFIFAMTFGWVIPIWLVKKAYKKPVLVKTEPQS